MKAIYRIAAISVALAATTGAGIASLADDAKKTDASISAVWAVPKSGDAMEFLVAGQPKPITITYSGNTVISGVCLHCVLPLKYKISESAKNCNVCGCDVTNAACIVGPAVKPATWTQTVKDLAYGTVFHITYNEPLKPESGAKIIVVDRKVVLLPVDGLSTQTPAQLAALLKPIGGTKPELLDGGSRLTFAVKDWTPALLAKTEKAITSAGGKIVRAEAEGTK